MKYNIVQIKELRVFEERPIMLSKMSQKRQRTKTWDGTGATDTGLHRLVYVSYFGFYMS